MSAGVKTAYRTGLFMVYAIVAGLILLLLIYMRFEAGFLKTVHIRYEQNSDKPGRIRRGQRHYSPAYNALRVMFVSDIHISKMFVNPDRINREINRYKPDVVLIGGDYIDNPAQLPQFFGFLKSLKLPRYTYLCYGNHDYRTFKKYQGSERAFLDALKKLNRIKILHNDSVIIKKNNRCYNIVGIEDVKYGNSDIPGAFSPLRETGSKTIVFSHNPDLIYHLKGRNVHHFLCGHFHGGQIWMPFHLEYRILRDDRLCKEGVYKGSHFLFGIHAYISRGLGNVLFPLRFLSRPEITFMDIP